MTETRHGLCGICPAGCFVTATLEDGRLVKVEPQEGNRLGMICQIGRHSPEIVHDPDRLLYPLRRIGPRGSHDFERISWDQAFERIVERLQETKRDFGSGGHGDLYWTRKLRHGAVRHLPACGSGGVLRIERAVP